MRGDGVTNPWSCQCTMRYSECNAVPSRGTLGKGWFRMSLRRRSTALIVAASVGAFLPGLVAAQPAGAANLVFGPGTFIANTTTLTLTGPSVSVTGVVQKGVAVFTFGNVTIPTGASIAAMGSRPFELMATGTLVLGGVISSNGISATQETVGPNAGGAGGGAGGTNGSTNGGGPGGGGHSSTEVNGAGGGGFASAGAPGGLDGSGTVGAGGAAYGNLDLALQGGSGGAGGSVTGSPTGGGGGGGAIGLFGSTVVIENTAGIIAVGGSGSGAGDAASGGGSGGGILVHGTTVQLNGVLAAPGGDGGGGGCCGDGGGGSGGRIAIQFKTLSSGSTLTTVVAGGSSGTSGSFGHGELSADATGGAGIVTFTHIDASQLTIGHSKSVRKGTTTSIVTRLTDGGSGSGIASAPVALYRRTLPSGTWKLVAARTTSAGGQALAPVKVMASAQYQWRYLGALTHGPVTSSTQSVLAT